MRLSSRLVLPEVSAVATRRGLGKLARRARGRNVVQVGEGRVLTTNLDGRPFYVDGHDMSLTPSVLGYGIYEPGTTRLLCRMVHTGYRVLEVGANVGWHTLLAAERVGPTGRVDAFEPNPVAFELLHLNLFVNGYWDRCRVQQMALSDATGSTELHVVGTFLGSGRLRPFTEGDLAWHRQDDHSFEVKMCTLDEAVAGDPRYDLMKIDVEGAEPRVFAGATEFFAANPRLDMVMEFTPRQHGQAMLNWLREAGFTIHSISRAGTLARASDRELLSKMSVDILARR